MSTTNVNNILPTSGSMVNLNGINVAANGITSFQFTTSNILRPATNSIIIGPSAGASLLSGSYNNVIIGYSSGNNTQNGYSNVFIGTATGGNNQNGALNTFIGSQAGQQSTQDGNTFIGWNAGSNASTTTNSTCIGANAQPSAGNAFSEFTLGNANVLTLRCAATTITAVSDERDKKDIKVLPVGLEFVKTLKPVEFVWDDRDEDGKHDIKDFGFIAQDLKKSQEDAGLADTLKLVYESNPDKLEASYGKLVPILVKAIQDLTAKVEELENKLK
jgi:hypothetical protein